ncbi:AraC family transcriptional regulator [Candidatus Clostridium helianthi]|jgi:AraC-type DNA-binding domain-containing proteins|uniref:AraC family transcriptional regulator n=1 Tax=Candidatus Clostridium helianthi TaxID=3381660 RepID=A0ABW8SDG7_9CLOT
MDYTKLFLHDDKSYNLKHSIFNSSTDIFPHAHNSYEIIHFVNFSGTYSVEGHIYEIGKNDILITNPNEIHRALLPPDTIFENQQLQLKEAYLAEFIFDDYNPFKALRHRELGCQNKIDASKVKEYGLDVLFDKITYYHENQLPESKVMIKALSLQLLTYVNNIVTITPVKKDNYTILEDILIYINNNLTQKITLKFLENKFFISKYNISRIFKQQIGYTFVEYITTKRILLAKELILNGMYASDAALEAGFSDYSNFYRCFKKATGISPYDYKTQLSKNTEINV